MISYSLIQTLVCGGEQKGNMARVRPPFSLQTPHIFFPLARPLYQFQVDKYVSANNNSSTL